MCSPCIITIFCQIPSCCTKGGSDTRTLYRSMSPELVVKFPSRLRYMDAIRNLQYISYRNTRTADIHHVKSTRLYGAAAAIMKISGNPLSFFIKGTSTDVKRTWGFFSSFLQTERNIPPPLIKYFIQMMQEPKSFFKLHHIIANSISEYRVG